MLLTGEDSHLYADDTVMTHAHSMVQCQHQLFVLMGTSHLASAFSFRPSGDELKDHHHQFKLEEEVTG